MKTSPLFRPKAVDQLADSDQLEHALTVTTPQIWIVALFLFSTSMLVVIWSVFGEIPSFTHTKGILLKENIAVESPATGILTEIKVEQGSKVRSGDVIAIIQDVETSNHQQNAHTLVEEKRQEVETLKLALEKENQLIEQYFTKRNVNLDELEELALESVRAAEAHLGVQLKLTEGGSYTPDIDDTRNRLYDAKQSLFDIMEQRSALAADELQRRHINNERLLAAERDLENTEKINSQLQENSTTQIIVAPFDGQIVDLNSYLGMAVQPGQIIASIETVEELELIFFIPPSHYDRVATGMTALIYPDTINREEFGALKGKVKEVSSTPINYHELIATLQYPVLVQQILSNGQPFKGIISLVQDASTVSGYAWTSKRGEAQAVGSGTFVDVEIEIDRKAPIGFVVPLFNNAPGP